MPAWACLLPSLGLSFLLEERGISLADPPSRASGRIKAWMERRLLCKQENATQNRTSGNWRLRHCSRLSHHHPYLENQIHLEVRALVYDPLLLVPEMSSAESAINYPLLGWVHCQDLFYQSAGCEKPDSA